MDQIAPADSGSVEEVIAFAVAFDTALDCDLVVVDRKPAGSVVEDDRYLREGRSRSPLTADVDDLLHLLASQVAGLARAEDPLDGVDDVRLAGTVRPNDGRNPAFEADLGRPGKRLEAQQAQ